MASELPLHLYREVFRPRPRLSLSQWADEFGHLSDGQRWDTSVVPYLREVMDATTDRAVREVVVEKAARLGYTEGIVGQRIGYDIHHDPERILVVFPTVDLDAKDWSQKTLRKMIENTPVLRALVPEQRGRESGNTILDKVFPGGSITVRGAQSPTGLRRHTARDVILDEVDGFGAASGEEGDPVMLATRANRTLPDRKLIMGSTPKLALNSRIRAALSESDWREYHVPCPYCREMQVLEWGGPHVAHGIKWAREVACRSCGLVLESDESGPCACGSEERATIHLPDSAHYVCRRCARVIEESGKPWMLEHGKWIPRYPGRAIRGYKIGGLLSPFEGSSWPNVVRTFLSSKADPALLQVWTNQWLGDPFEAKGATIDAATLESRAVQFVQPGGALIEVPDGVGILTAGVDVHPDRLELLVRGHGLARESWNILHERIYGEPKRDDTWARLDHFLTRSYRHQTGGSMWVMMTFVDSKDGNTIEDVYRYVRTREARNVWAARGDAGNADAKIPKRPVRSHSSSVLVWNMATFAAKASLFYRLALTLRAPTGGPGRIHLRAQTPTLCNGFDAEFYAQFAAEEKRRVRIKGTAKYEERYVQTRARNEAIDLHVLADSAFLALGTAVVENMAEWVDLARQPPPKEEEPVPVPPEPEGDWASGGRSWGSGWR